MNAVRRCLQEAHWIINTAKDTHYYCCADHVDKMMEEKQGVVLTWLEEVGIVCEHLITSEK